MIVLDVEHRNMRNSKDETNAAKNVGKLSRMADEAKRLRPDSRVGFYSLMPLIE